MRINTNVSAMNAHRNLWQTGNAMASSMQKLSSGYRINRAGDDAAGLGIANSLRASIRALSQASRNSEQATAVLQIQEGAAQQVQSIVERMKELATQSVSDNVDNTGRAAIDAEYQDLLSEINRIAASTKFQGKELINGNFGTYVDLAASSLDADVGYGSASLSGTEAATYTFTHTANSLSVSNGLGVTQVLNITGHTAGTVIDVDQFGIKLTTDAAFVAGNAGELDGTIVVAATASAEFVVGSSGVIADDKVTLNAINLTTAAAGLNLVGSALDTDSNAETALSSINSALDTLSTTFGEIGAKQNRIEYATQNVKTAIENYSAAESTIRDVDMASEMTQFSKFQILQQAGTAMLAQANQSSQVVLQLLRG
jgi:flagellin